VICIVDIDGTLAHRGQRDPYDYETSGVDVPNPLVVRLVRVLANAGVTFAYFTGREERTKDKRSTREITQQWIDRHVSINGPVYMRPEGDYRKDAVVKLEMLAKYCAEHHCQKTDILCVLDDRKQVVEMWRNEGLLCLDVAGNAF
jgi:hydroxymethylpyrimidine pyrophosphatase-like HAD family hydrolase